MCPMFINITHFFTFHLNIVRASFWDRKDQQWWGINLVCHSLWFCVFGSRPVATIMLHFCPSPSPLLAIRYQLMFMLYPLCAWCSPLVVKITQFTMSVIRTQQQFITLCVLSYHRPLSCQWPSCVFLFMHVSLYESEWVLCLLNM